MPPEIDGHNDDSTAEPSVFKAHRSKLPAMVVEDGVATETELEQDVQLGRRVPAPCDDSDL